MTNKSAYLSAFLLLLVLAGCKKENTTTPDPPKPAPEDTVEGIYLVSGIYDLYGRVNSGWIDTNIILPYDTLFVTKVQNDTLRTTIQYDTTFYIGMGETTIEYSGGPLERQPANTNYHSYLFPVDLNYLDASVKFLKTDQDSVEASFYRGNSFGRAILTVSGRRIR